jgi:hypothetical protein
MGVTPDAMPSNFDLAACGGCFFLTAGGVFWFLSCCCLFLAAVLDEAVVSALAAALPASPVEVLESAGLSLVVIVGDLIRYYKILLFLSMIAIDLINRINGFDYLL